MKMSLLKTIMKFAAPAPEIESFGRYLFVGPHPDDIEIGAGAAAAKLASMGKEVHFLICTDGRYGDGHTDIHGDELAKCRMAESEASAKALGATSVRFLGLSDGAQYTIDEMKRGIASVIGELKPDMILCPDPDADSECHSDHLNTGRACKELACFAPYPGIMASLGAESAPVAAIGFYFTAKPNRYINTTGFLDAQLDAIFSNHRSQFPQGGSDVKMISTYLKLKAYDYGVRNLCKTAEGFRVLGDVNMHCLPESGN